jgi:hypothetical protein
VVLLTQLRSDLAASDLSSGKPSVNQVELSGSIAPDTKQEYTNIEVIEVDQTLLKQARTELAAGIFQAVAKVEKKQEDGGC